MKINNTVLKKVERYVIDRFNNELSKEYTYHTLGHTLEVVKNSALIGEREELTEEEMSILLVAAWFHDLGYLKKYMGHEVESAKIANEFLNTLKIDKNDIKAVLQAIMNTAYPSNSKDVISKVLCDADFLHISEKDYFKKAENLRKEYQNLGIRILTKQEFLEESMTLFETHFWHTSYCWEIFDSMKQQNLISMKDKINNKVSFKHETEENKKFSRGVDSMFRLTARNQINLSQIADNKSNILISLNGIIISVAIATLFRRFNSEPAIIFPTMLFILFSLSTIVLAILSTRPNIRTSKSETGENSPNRKNLLFFGYFHQMKMEDYKLAIQDLINANPQKLYSALTTDQYLLGTVLARKYKLLKWAYNVFMIGMILTVGAFLSVFL